MRGTWAIGSLLLSAGLCAGLVTGIPSAPTRSDRPTGPIANGRGTDEPLQPLETFSGLDSRIVHLGRRLFHDPRLSGDGTVSCASCHDLDHGGVDGKRFAEGFRGAVGPINTPTVYNAALNFRQFWDGRAATLEEQAAGPMTNPIEMAGTWDDILATLSADETYRTSFEALYSDGVQRENILDAIATFERTLITVDSPFDRFLQGDRTALSESATRGYQLFKDRGCVACHQGRNVGGNLYQRFGIFGDYFADRGEVTEADLGRFAVTGEEADRHVFKVPGLRNVELTAPYFHDGSATTLAEAVRIMGRYQLGLELPDQEVRDLVNFLCALTGKQSR